MSHAGGVTAGELAIDDLLRELESLAHTRVTTLRHGSAEALSHHIARMAALEKEYLRRFPEREVDPGRTREGARHRDDAPIT